MTFLNNIVQRYKHMPAKKPSVSLRQRANRFGVRLTFDNRLGGRTRRSTSAISNEIRRTKHLKFGVKYTPRSPKTLQDLKRLDNERNAILVGYAIVDKRQKITDKQAKLKKEWEGAARAKGGYAADTAKGLWKQKNINGKKRWVSR